jgi:hypothetical protein
MLVLNVPYAEKDKARALGARWDAKIKKWYVPDGVTATPFESWIPDGMPGVVNGAAAQAASSRVRAPGGEGNAAGSAAKERVDSYAGKATVGAHYVELAHDCNPFMECEQCKLELNASGWNAAKAAVDRMLPAQ